MNAGLFRSAKRHFLVRPVAMGKATQCPKPKNKQDNYVEPIHLASILLVFTPNKKHLSSPAGIVSNDRTRHGEERRKNLLLTSRSCGGPVHTVIVNA
ncbi:hypothetical protein EVAR_93801_1 [Eumeta japonica]|uniref:Uncharacterized protein n=1 Tax=Eumeta variegata TaxID=151549 RepID=A0A4C1VAH2_EUMVA|nr:hypothetical protein EVAR_93801_1 [Eumeta japonica]